VHDLPEESAERLARVAKLLRTQQTLPARLETVVALAKRLIPNCDAAGVTLIVEGEPTTTAVTDRLTVEVDLVQYQTGEGPCLAAMAESNVVRVDMVEADSRFVRFAPGAVDLEVNSVLSVPLAARGRTVGALNLYSRAPDAFDARTTEEVRPFAELAAEAVSTSPLYAYSLDAVEGLMETLEARALIEQASGMIVASERRTSEEAMDRLREIAMAGGESLRAVAERVVRQGPAGNLPADHGQPGGS
jgi:GAF domain-containing protein